MNGKDPEKVPRAPEIHVLPPSPYTEVRKPSIVKEKISSENDPTSLTDKNSEKPSGSYLYDSRQKTILGRDSFKWLRLAAFYTVFYFCLACFFVIMLYVFALLLDREIPRYYNKASTMAVRTAATVVGMGFRPQPEVEDSLIEASNNPVQQKRIASSLRLFRDVYLLQKSDGKIEDCSEEEPASELVHGAACSFNWFHIVDSQDHPCSDNNMYGFKNEQPCILVKINKVYGWTPLKGPIPIDIQKLMGVNSNKSVSKPDVYVTCDGSNVADHDVLGDLKYYSLGKSSGSLKYGVVPNHFFPYRNAPDHVQPFVLVQFTNLPINRLVSVTCRVWAPNIKHDTRAMRGMVTFQLLRSHRNAQQPQGHN